MRALVSEGVWGCTRVVGVCGVNFPSLLVPFTFGQPTLSSTILSLVFLFVVAAAFLLPTLDSLLPSKSTKQPNISASFSNAFMIARARNYVNSSK